MWKNARDNHALITRCQDHHDVDQQLLGLLHRPGTVYCWRCGLKALERDAKARPRSCDGCGRDAKDFRHIALTLDTMITITGSICEACAVMAGALVTLDIDPSQGRE